MCVVRKRVRQKIKVRSRETVMWKLWWKNKIRIDCWIGGQGSHVFITFYRGVWKEQRQCFQCVWVLYAQGYQEPHTKTHGLTGTGCSLLADGFFSSATKAQPSANIREAQGQHKWIDSLTHTHFHTHSLPQMTISPYACYQQHLFFFFCFQKTGERWKIGMRPRGKAVVSHSSWQFHRVTWPSSFRPWKL